jgi:hypothetical protein
MGVILGTRTAELTLALRKPQLVIINNRKRYKIVVAGRRFGKTYLVKAELVGKATAKPNQLVWYVAPTYRQAKDLMWTPLKEFVPKSYIKHKDETDLSMILRNGSKIALRGADNPDSLRGPGLDHVAFDEAAFQDAYVWDVVYYALTDKLGTATFITTPNGFNWIHDLVTENDGDEEWAYFHYTTAEGGNVSQKEIEKARAKKDPRMFRQEMEASFENLSGRVYYAYDRIHNSPEGIEDSIGLPLRVGMDFNVDPMTASLSVREGAILKVFDEITIPNGNTVLMAQTIRARFPNRPIIVYPDPTGNSQHTNAPVGQTDFTLLRSFGFQLLAPGHAYSQTDKINMTNAALLNAAGTRRVMIAKRCKKLIKALDGHTYVEGTSVPDKKQGLDHWTDNLAYLVCGEYPLAEPMRRIKALV